MKKIVPFILIFVLFVVNVFAIGIAPAKTEIIFESDIEQTLTYRIYNTELKDFTAKIETNGTLSKYLNIPNNNIKFTKEEHLKNFVIELNLPTKYEELSAEIIIHSPTANVKSKIFIKPNNAEIPSKNIIPTGNTVTTDESTTMIIDSSWLIPGLLIIIIFVNVIYFTVGKVVLRRKSKRTVEDIIKKVRRMSSRSFHKHANDENNDVAKWLEEINRPGLAFKIYDVTNQNMMIKRLESSITGVEKEKSPNELKKEIIELKKELDTFDFGEFEKTL